MWNILKAGFFIDSSQNFLADAASVPLICALYLAVMTYSRISISIKA